MKSFASLLAAAAMVASVSASNFYYPPTACHGSNDGGGCSDLWIEQPLSNKCNTLEGTSYWHDLGDLIADKNSMCRVCSDKNCKAGSCTGYQATFPNLYSGAYPKVNGGDFGKHAEAYSCYEVNKNI